jgi:MoCo/4Fe-4S cofactor protein with predicted Tat translocation signal
MENKNQYWRGLEELNNDPTFLASKKHEFAEGIPLEEVFTEEDGDLTSNRRDFLKYFGFGISAVALAACNKTPVKNAIPYIVKPENITPGIPNWYASTCNACSANCSILVKTREGRPIKIEGNTESPVFKGGVCGTGHASLLGLYDNERLRKPRIKGADASWEAIDKEIPAALAGAKNVALITGTVNSPSTKKAIAALIAKYPQVKHIAYEPFSYGAIAKANKESFGKEVIPGYRFDLAKVIVSFGADFLGTWISPVEYTKQWAKNRSAEDKTMSRHIQIESYLSVTGSNADVRYPIKPSAETAYLISLYNKIASLANAPALGSLPPVELPVNGIENAAKELWANKGQSIVVSGSNNIGAQVIVNAINTLLGNIGTTVDLANYSNQHYSDDAAFANFVNELSSGAADGVIFYNVNPVYSYAEGAKLAEAIKKAKVSISSGANLDETSSVCMYNTPDSHFLESWNDNEPKAGYFTFTQPTISTVFDTRQMQESLLKWSGVSTNFYDFMLANWAGSLSGDSWTKALHDGFYQASVSPVTITFNAEAAKGIESSAYELYSSSVKKTELKLYAKVGVGAGEGAHNPWLQEMPDPISKVCWDNYAAISHATAKEIGVKDGDKVNITFKTGKIESVPVLVQPGQPNNVVAVAVGYGRTAGGKTGLNVGINAYTAATFNTTQMHMQTDVKIEKADGKYELAHTQTHHTIEGRAIIKEASLGEYIKDSRAGNQDHHKSLKENGNLITLWSERDSKGHKWTMAIDLNKCTGCGACVVSCNAENNVPVVGRKEVLNRREMHWIRIDRYYRFRNKENNFITKEDDYNNEATGVDFENVSVTFQPVMCQQCGHAPCETVCPVLATVHSSEGLNHMAYNRCVGTRYCANNCPYKVRRFNWFKYRENDQFDFNFNNDLGRMVINPDVTVRSRGVMEKCSFCVQRIQAGKLKAKLENRTIADGDIQTACQQSCPADAIIFGDINDEKSKVREYFQKERAYFVLEELNVQPSVAYMTKIRNVNETLVHEHGHGAAKHEDKHEEHKKDEKHAEHHS